MKHTSPSSIFLFKIIKNNYKFQASAYFTISEDTGMLRTQRSLRNINDLPMILVIEAQDNNGALENSHKTTARIVINLISDSNRLALVFSDSSPKEIRNHYGALEELLAERTNGYITGIERFANRKYLNINGTISENPSATDVWFYVIDPISEKILSIDSKEIMERFLDSAAQSEINLAASGIARATAQGIFAPIVAKEPIQKVRTAVAINEEVFPYTLIAVAIIILILGTIGIIYICISWSKYKNFKQRMRQYSAPSSPTRYDPVIVGSQSGDAQTNLKEYETQVLAMAVSNDEGDDLQIDFSAKNHAFSLDNVSYITHKENGKTFNL